MLDYRLQEFCDEGHSRIRDGFVSVCLDTCPRTEYLVSFLNRKDTKSGPETHPNLIVTICFKKMKEWVLHRVLTLMCCFVCGCGPYDWHLDSTCSPWVILPLACVKWCQDECEVWIRDGFVSMWLDTCPHRDTITGPETHLNLMWHNLFWEDGGVSLAQSTDFDDFFCVGADRTADVSTRRVVREWSCPWHLWSDVRTSVKCSVWRMGGVERDRVHISLDCRLP